MKCIGCIQFSIILTSLQVILVGQGFADDTKTEPAQWAIGVGIPIGL